MFRFLETIKFFFSVLLNNLSPILNDKNHFYKKIVGVNLLVIYSIHLDYFNLSSFYDFTNKLQSIQFNL